MGLRPSEIFKPFSTGTALYTSEPDVYRRQVLMYIDGLRAEMVNPEGTKLDNSNFLLLKFCLAAATHNTLSR